MNSVLLVGLGNPGNRYDLTRHNMGFWWAQEIAKELDRVGATSFGPPQWQLESRTPAQTWRRWDWRGAKIVLVCPQTFMNRSGEALRDWVKKLDLTEASQILVAHDELDLPPGTFRLKQGGGNGGHNGLKSVESVLASLSGGPTGYGRVRLGIGHPDRSPAPSHCRDVADYVLESMTTDEQSHWAQQRDSVVAASLMAMQGQWKEAMNREHGRVSSS